MGDSHQVLTQGLKVLRVPHELVKESLEGLVFDLLIFLVCKGRIRRHSHEGESLELERECLMESLELIEGLPGLHQNIILALLPNVDLDYVVLQR